MLLDTTLGILTLGKSAGFQVLLKKMWRKQLIEGKYSMYCELRCKQNEIKTIQGDVDGAATKRQITQPQNQKFSDQS